MKYESTLLGQNAESSSTFQILLYRQATGNGTFCKVSSQKKTLLNFFLYVYKGIDLFFVLVDRLWLNISAFVKY